VFVFVCGCSLIGVCLCQCDLYDIQITQATAMASIVEQLASNSTPIKGAVAVLLIFTFPRARKDVRRCEPGRYELRGSAPVFHVKVGSFTSRLVASSFDLLFTFVSLPLAWISP
jgi:hypothetical protein